MHIWPYLTVFSSSESGDFCPTPDLNPEAIFHGTETKYLPDLDRFLTFWGAEADPRPVQPWIHTINMDKFKNFL